jgi:hypothetical protein
MPIGTIFNNIHDLKWTPEIDHFFDCEEAHLIDSGSNIDPSNLSTNLSSNTFSSIVENIVGSEKNEEYLAEGDFSSIKNSDITSKPSPSDSNITDIIDKDSMLSFYYEVHIDLVDLASFM